MTDTTQVEVLIIARRYSGFRKCVESVMAHSSCGILAVINGPNSAISGYLEAVERQNPSVRHIALECKVEKSAARNIALEKASGDILYFLDDDAFVEADNAGLMAEKFRQYPDASFIGGPNLTPPGSGFFQRAAGYALSSPFAAAGMRSRFSRARAEGYCDDSSLTLCNLALRKKVVEEDKLRFDSRLYYNEENLFLRQSMDKGRKMIYCPGISVYHERRRSVLQFAEQVFRSGEGRGRMTMIMPESLAAVYIMPLLFVLYLAAFSFTESLSYFLPLAAYTLLSLLSAAAIVRSEKEPAGMFVAMLFLPFIAHVSYGAGFAWGAGRYLICRK